MKNDRSNEDCEKKKMHVKSIKFNFIKLIHLKEIVI